MAEPLPVPPAEAPIFLYFFLPVLPILDSRNYNSNYKAFYDKRRLGWGRMLVRKGRQAPEFDAEQPARCSVLVVDDEADIIRILTKALEGAGYSVTEALDATAAWELLEKYPVDIIVCDIMMPNVSGLEFCQKVKQDERLKHCHFILLTAKSEVRDRVEGLNAGADDYIPKPFDIEELLARVRAGGRIISSRRDLQEESMTDPLTQLYSRKVLWPFMEKELARARRYGYGLSLLLIDIDNFKQLNDTHGHLAGDEVLKQMGNLIHDRLRTSDIAVRFGGEEFVLLLPQTDAAGAEVLGRWFCHAVRKNRFQYQGTALPFTISIGAASLANFPDATPHSLFEQADIALYQAKIAGRDRVFTAQPVQPKKTDSPLVLPIKQKQGVGQSTTRRRKNAT